MTPEERAKKFQDELKPLLEKYKIDIGAYPLILPDGRVGAKLSFYDSEEIEKRLKELKEKEA